METEIGRNQYEQEVDSAGYQRSSDQYAVRGGLEFDLGEKFSGEVAAGWITEDFRRRATESAVDADRGGRTEMVAGARHRRDAVRLNHSSRARRHPAKAARCSIRSNLGIERQIRANLTGNALLGAAYRNYAESDGYGSHPERRGQPDTGG